MGAYDDTTTVEVELPTELLAALDEAGREGDYDSRSEAVQAAVAVWVGAVGDAADDGGAFDSLTDRLGERDVDVGVDVDVLR